ncbi:MAG: type IX secretion system membrane protein PorP/SprF [Chitinophagales bacterium]|nr:type IX secretion system membrane protein PorP/SprF [Chitinophagales bacterium]
MTFISKYFLTLFVVLSFAVSSFGQIDKSQFTQFQFNKLIYNPAFAGDRNYFEASAFHRSQWVNLSGRAFATQSLSVHFPLVSYNSGVGISIVNDLIGVQRSTFVMGNYAYKVPLTFAVLSVGVSVGIIQSALDGSKLRAPDGTYEPDQSIDHSDDFLPESLQGGIGLDAGFGIYLSNDNWYAGISTAHIPGSTVTIKAKQGNAKLKYEREYYAMGGYKFRLGSTFSLEPSVLFKTDMNKAQVDFSNLAYYKDNIWIGVSFRGYNKSSIDALGLLFGFQLTQKFMVNYSYDVSTSFKNSFNDGSHELSVLYKFKIDGKGRKGSVIYNPRFL